MPPEDTDKELKHQCALADFGAAVLEILEQEDDWSADTLDRISAQAFDRNLAKDDEESQFKRII